MTSLARTCDEKGESRCKKDVGPERGGKEALKRVEEAVDGLHRRGHEKELELSEGDAREQNERMAKIINP